MKNSEIKHYNEKPENLHFEERESLYEFINTTVTDEEQVLYELSDEEIAMMESEAIAPRNRLDMTFREEENIFSALLTAYSYGMAKGIRLAIERDREEAAEQEKGGRQDERKL